MLKISAVCQLAEKPEFCHGFQSLMRPHPFVQNGEKGCGLTYLWKKRKTLETRRESRALELLARFELATSSLPRMCPKTRKTDLNKDQIARKIGSNSAHGNIS